MPALAVIGLVVWLAMLSGVERSGLATVVVHDVDPERGIVVIRGIVCGRCHTIPGIHGADGLVGPPLDHWAKRSFIAGRLPNTPENLVQWIQDTHAIDPESAMPTLGLAEQQARDVAAYLYTLQ